MLLNNYANTINQNHDPIEPISDNISNNNIPKKNRRGLSRFLFCNNDNNNDDQCCGNTGFSVILFFILILLILFNSNNN